MKNDARTLGLSQFTSMGEMSAQTGIPEDLLKNAKRSGCPFIRHGRCDLGTFLRWYFSRDLDGEEQENWTLRDKRASALIKETNYTKNRNMLIDKGVVDAFITEVVAIKFFGELQRLEKEFPTTLKAKSEVAIAAEVKRQIDMIKKSFEERIARWKEETEDPSLTQR